MRTAQRRDLVRVRVRLRLRLRLRVRVRLRLRVRSPRRACRRSWRRARVFTGGGAGDDEVGADHQAGARRGDVAAAVLGPPGQGQGQG